MKAKLYVSKEREPAASLESARPRYSLPKYGPGDYVRIEIILGGGKQRRSGCVDHCDDEHSIVFGTIDDDSSHRLGKALTTGSKLAASFHRVREAEPQCVDSSMPSVSRSTKRFSYLPATCTVRCSSPSLAANTDSCIREYSASDARNHQAAGRDPNSKGGQCVLFREPVTSASSNGQASCLGWNCERQP